ILNGIFTREPLLAVEEPAPVVAFVVLAGQAHLVAVGGSRLLGKCLDMDGWRGVLDEPKRDRPCQMTGDAFQEPSPDMVAAFPIAVLQQRMRSKPQKPLVE